LKINLSVRKFESVRTKTKLFSAAKPITISIPTQKFDTKAIQKGFIANFIHSMDAANIHILINMLKELNLGDIPLYTIHDCFATTPNNMEKLNKVILSAFIQLYFENNYLVKLWDNIEAQICSYGYKIIERDGNKYVVGPETDKIIPFPSPPSALLEKWESNKKIFVESIKKSTYFIS
jgi:DNA-directed RNA polymerase